MIFQSLEISPPSPFLRKISFRNPTILTPILVLPGSTCIVVTCIELKRCEHHCLLYIFISKVDRGNRIGGENLPTLIHSFARAIFSRVRPSIVRSSTRLSCSKVFANCQAKWHQNEQFLTPLRLPRHFAGLCSIVMPCEIHSQPS